MFASIDPGRASQLWCMFSCHMESARLLCDKAGLVLYRLTAISKEIEWEERLRVTTIEQLQIKMWSHKAEDNFQRWLETLFTLGNNSRGEAGLPRHNARNLSGSETSPNLVSSQLSHSRLSAHDASKCSGTYVRLSINLNSSIRLLRAWCTYFLQLLSLAC